MLGKEVSMPFVRDIECIHQCGIMKLHGRKRCHIGHKANDIKGTKRRGRITHFGRTQNTTERRYRSATWSEWQSVSTSKGVIQSMEEEILSYYNLKTKSELLQCALQTKNDQSHPHAREDN